MPDHYPLFDSCHFVAGGRYHDKDRPDHEGLDFTPNDVNNPPLVPSMAEGRVIYANGGPGLPYPDGTPTVEWIVIIQHDGWWSAYGHIREHSLLVTAGQWVTQYENLATLGYSGYTEPKGIGGSHCHIQTGPGTYHGHISENPTFDPMTKLQGGVDSEDMTEEQHNVAALESYYKAAGDRTPHQSAVDRVLGGQTFEQVIVNDLKLRLTQQQADVYAIEAYATADGLDSPHQFAVDKTLAGAAPVQVFREVLGTLHGWLDDKDKRIDDLITATTTQQDLINQGTEKITDLTTKIQQRDAEIVQLKEALANASQPPQAPSTPTKTIWEQLVEAMSTIFNKKA